MSANFPEMDDDPLGEKKISIPAHKPPEPPPEQRRYPVRQNRRPPLTSEQSVRTLTLLHYYL